MLETGAVFQPTITTVGSIGTDLGFSARIHQADHASSAHKVVGCLHNVDSMAEVVVWVQRLIHVGDIKNKVVEII